MTNYEYQTAIRIFKSGYQAGLIQSIEVDSLGKLIATYNNGISVHFGTIFLTKVEPSEDVLVVPYQPYYRTWINKNLRYTMPAATLAGCRFIERYLEAEFAH